MKPGIRRLINDDGRVLPQQGDLARVLTEMRFESGVVLKRNQNVIVSVVTPENPFVGIRWRDDDGTHVTAIPLSNLEVVV